MYRVGCVKRHTVLATIPLRIHLSVPITCLYLDTSHRLNELTYPACWVFTRCSPGTSSTFCKTSARVYQDNLHSENKSIFRDHKQIKTSNLSHQITHMLVLTNTDTEPQNTQRHLTKLNPHLPHQYLSEIHIKWCHPSCYTLLSGKRLFKKVKLILPIRGFLLYKLIEVIKQPSKA